MRFLRTASSSAARSATPLRSLRPAAASFETRLLPVALPVASRAGSKANSRGTHMLAKVAGPQNDVMTKRLDDLSPAKELERTCSALRDALIKLELMKEQAAIVDALQAQLVEQEGFIEKLSLVVVDQRASELPLRNELAAKVAEAEARLTDAQRAELSTVRELKAQLEANGDCGHKLSQQMEDATRMRSEAEQRLSEARAEAQLPLSALASHLQLLKCLEEEKKLAQAMASRPPPSRGKGRGAEITLQQIKDEARLLQLTLTRKELAMTNLAAEVASLQDKESRASAELAASLAKLEASKKVLLDRLAEMESAFSAEQSVTVALQQQLSDMVSEKEASMDATTIMELQIESMRDDQMAAREEGERLVGLIEAAMAENGRQAHAVSELEAELQAFISSMGQMHADYESLRDGLVASDQLKEEGLAELATVHQKGSNTYAELLAAREKMVTQQELLGSMNITHHELEDKRVALVAELGECRKVMAVAEGRMEEAEGRLAELSGNVMKVKTELGYKSQSFSDACLTLNVIRASDSPNQQQIKALAAALEERQRVDGAVIEEARREMEALSASNSEIAGRVDVLEGGVNELQEQKRELDEAAALFKELGLDIHIGPEELRKCVVSTVQDNNEMVASLGSAIEQVEYLQSQELERDREMRAAYASTTSLSRELVRLHQELSAHLSDMSTPKAKVDLVELSRKVYEAAVQTGGLAEKEASIAEAEAAKLKALEEAALLEATIEALNTELNESLEASESATSPLSCMQDLDSIDDDVALLVSKLQEEVLSTKALLSKVESLLQPSLPSTSAAAAAAAYQSLMTDQMVDIESVRELVETRDNALRGQLEAEALRERIRTMEDIAENKEALHRHIVSALRQGANPAIRILTQTTEELSQENEGLESKSFRRVRGLRRVRKFMKARVPVLV